ncbi:hypothetical protein [Brevifollis gellanilyticus]|uniref:Uncharacterized protein n=1 Tax=Brevifollis gellanilyticus TaxID=748831 RepID=A0A512M738_9BACT|nr:hypothetical protein [Brevifollis gellanilyticus]GEP42546.1 hypothetical protein BGE01nite_18370 [Brevifollis gellanilyticus]
MKWSWKIFCIQLVVLFGAALGASIIVSKIIDAQRGIEAPDSTIPAMRIGGILACVLFSAIGGWKRWNPKMALVNAAIVSGLYAKLPGTFLGVLFGAAAYFIASKLHDLISFYTLPADAPEDHPDSGNQPTHEQARSERDAA